YVETELEMPWRKVLETVTAGGVHFAFDPPTQGAAVLIQSSDAATLDKFLGAVLDLAELDAKFNKKDEIRSGQYRGVKVYRVDRARFAVADRWLVICNNDELGKRIVDLHLDGGDATLARNEQFRAARKSIADAPVVWAYVNVAALRDAGAAKDAFRGKSDNPVAELLAGGLLATAQHTPYLTLSGYLTPKQLRLVAAAPHEAAWAGEAREYFFGPRGQGVAPPLLSPAGTILSVSTHRDIAQMWLRADDLLDEKAVDQLAQADSNLSTLFAGKDFGEQILGSFQPDVQIVAVRQDFADVLPRPAIKLPAAAIVFRLKEPEAMMPEMRRTFQSLVGFLNIVGAQQGQPPLDIDIDKADGLQLVHASYVPTEDEKESTSARINYNFSPTVAFAGDRFVIASTTALARQLGEAKPALARAKGANANTELTLHAATLREALADNRDQLVAQNMLKEGHTREEAQQQVDGLLAVLGVLHDASLSLDVTDSTVQLSAELNLNDVE
ncbi:MAG: hypothetical protein KDA41_16690, partial [Planctomycetales bacterium]|nr:hypothetical protein [Planctomycetales bacterium]